MSNTINGFILEKMLRNALNNIYVHEKEINDMNVFPVADGDTGTNMRLTLENGLNNSNSDKHLGQYLKSVSKGMLLGARGNSGVILSQLFKGMAEELKSKSIVNPGEMTKALIIGYKTAYKAVLNPVEGTILTVTRLGIENIKAKIKGNISIKETFKLYLAELNKSLELTPSLLPVLKEADVLDSGAKGYIVIVEGMYKYLLGQIIERDLLISEEEIKEEEIRSEEGFYMELSVKLKNSDIPYESLNEKLKELSVSYKLKVNDGVVSIKASTLNPTPIITEVKKYGDIISMNLENKKLTSKVKSVEKEIPFKAIIYIACVSGSGVRNLYKDLGVDLFLPLNPSTQDFVIEFKKCNAERIVILPNDKNIIETANQAVQLSRQNNITILPTKNMIEGYYALAMDVPDSSIENRLEAISESVGVECLNISKAIKNYNNGNIHIVVDDYVAYLNNQVLAGSKNIFDCLSNALSNVEEIDSKSSVFILIGQNAPSDIEDELNDFFSDNYPSLEVNILSGEQEKEELIIGLL